MSSAAPSVVHSTAVSFGRLEAVSRVLQAIVTRGVEVLTVLLFASECLVVFSGVVARYVFQSPIVEIDEISSLLFRWLAMLGAVLAFRTGAHMRMTALVDRLKPRAQALFARLAMAVALVFLVLILSAGTEAALDERDVTMTATGISNAWNVLALPVGAALMLALWFLEQLVQGRRQVCLGAAAALIALAAGAGFLTPVLADLGQVNLIIFFCVILGTGVFTGVPLVFAFGLSTFAYVTFATHAPATIVASRIGEGMSHLVLLSIPLFVFLGKLIEATGLARAMIGFLAALLGRVRGGLSYPALFTRNARSKPSR